MYHHHHNHNGHTVSFSAFQLFSSDSMALRCSLSVLFLAYQSGWLPIFIFAAFRD
jgi:hypothetical protein